MQTSGRRQLDDATRRVFAPRAKRPLTNEDVRQITANLTGFFGILREWADAEKDQPAVAAATTASKITAVNGEIKPRRRPKSQGGRV